MPSPFPGMNPFLEQAAHWQDFHTELLTIVRRVLTPQVGPNSIVRLEEHVSTRDTPAEVEIPGQDEERIRYLEVRDRRGRELVTVIEVLGPSNKRAGEDRELYLARRREVLRGPAHLVEVDLLRGGTPAPVVNRPVCDYSVMVSRAERRPRAGFWAVGLRDRLPVIPVPLRAGDGDARVDLQEALHAAYDAAGYERYIYEGAPEPPLAPDDAAWAAPFLPAGP
jgi:hypothetical protein